MSNLMLIRNPACIFSSAVNGREKAGVRGGAKRNHKEELGKVDPSIFISDPNA